MINAIEVKDLYFKYKGQADYILEGINLTIQKGDIVGIAGLSGGGKSTLCYAIKGIIPHRIGGYLTGQIRILGRDIESLNNHEKVSRIGMVFQDPDSQLFSSSVEDELAFALENMCVSRKEMILKVDEMLTLLELTKYRHDNPSYLSGGEKQLVALGAVLILEPDIILFDEAMSQVDSNSKKKLKQIIKMLQKRDKTIIMVDHDLNNMDIAHRIVLLEDGKIKDYKGER